jgi:hypothetical protein
MTSWEYGHMSIAVDVRVSSSADPAITTRTVRFNTRAGTVVMDDQTAPDSQLPSSNVLVFLDQLGEEGWELVTRDVERSEGPHPDGGAESSSIVTYMLKRPKG